MTIFFLNYTVLGIKQADGGKETGCFDLTCPGFVQTSHEIALGAALYPIPNSLKLPTEIKLLIHYVRTLQAFPFHFGTFAQRFREC